MEPTITLEPCNIRQVWDEVRPGLEAIKERWPESNTWRPEDIYAEVVNGDAVLYMHDGCFAVCTIEADRWTETRDLFIWVAYAPPHKRGGTARKYWPSFIEVAKRLGCSGIQLGTRNPVLSSLEFLEPLHTTYRHEITEETKSDG